MKRVKNSKVLSTDLEPLNENFSLSPTSEVNFEELSYLKEHKLYHQFKDHQMLQIMVRKISCSSRINYLNKSLPMFRLLFDLTQELLMNEFEITIFSIYIDRIGCKNNLSLPPHDILFFLAYAAKKYLQAPISHLDYYIEKKNKKFKEKYYEWERNILKWIDVDIKEINEIYSKLIHFNFEKSVNYNFYVDEILQISHPYKVESKETSKQNVKFVEEKPRFNNRNLFYVEKLRPKTEILVNFEEDIDDELGNDHIYSMIDTICDEFINKNLVQPIPVEKCNDRKLKNSFLNAILSSQI